MRSQHEKCRFGLQSGSAAQREDRSFTQTVAKLATNETDINVGSSPAEIRLRRLLSPAPSSGAFKPDAGPKKEAFDCGIASKIMPQRALISNAASYCGR